MDYITLGWLREDKSIVKTGDDPLLRRYISRASALWDIWTQRRFLPQKAVRRFNEVDGATLYLDDDLLAISSLTNGNGDSIASDAYVLQPDNRYPKREIVLLSASGLSWQFTYPDSRILVDGLWGYHNDYPNAWGDSLDTVQDAPLTANAVTVTVTDADGLDNRGMTRFEVLDYLLVEDEQMQVIGITANTLSVIRGVNGTTAVAHTQGTAIKVYRQMPEVVFAVSEIAKWMYEHRDKVSTGVQLAEGLGVIIVRELPEVKALADSFAPDWFGVV